MLIQHPNISILDLHIHAYVVGSKYEVLKLCEYAIEQYIDFAAKILTLLGPDPAALLSNTTAPVVEPMDCTLINTFLDSLVLLWKKTSTYDGMRKAVLQLMRPDLHRLLKVPFFQTLMVGVPGFAEDVARDLGEDGLEVQVKYAGTGGKQHGGMRLLGVSRGATTEGGKWQGSKE